MRNVVLQRVCDELGYEYRDYSGRGMYGKRCFAIVSENACKVCIDIAYELGAQGEDCWGLDDVRSDSMGYDKVIYWPNIAPPTNETEEEEEEEEVSE